VRGLTVLRVLKVLLDATELQVDIASAAPQAVDRNGHQGKADHDLPPITPSIQAVPVKNLPRLLESSPMNAGDEEQRRCGPAVHPSHNGLRDRRAVRRFDQKRKCHDHATRTPMSTLSTPSAPSAPSVSVRFLRL
jgi:hypothetical protein